MAYKQIGNPNALAVAAHPRKAHAVGTANRFNRWLALHTGFELAWLTAAIATRPNGRRSFLQR